jgi:hypothetical protein
MLASRAWERYCDSASLVSPPHSWKPGVNFLLGACAVGRGTWARREDESGGGFYADLISGKDRLIEPKDKQLRAAETLVLA